MRALKRFLFGEGRATFWYLAFHFWVTLLWLILLGARPTVHVVGGYRDATLDKMIPEVGVLLYLWVHCTYWGIQDRRNLWSSFGIGFLASVIYLGVWAAFDPTYPPNQANMTQAGFIQDLSIFAMILLSLFVLRKIGQKDEPPPLPKA